MNVKASRIFGLVVEEAAHAEKGNNFSETQADAALGKRQVSGKAKGISIK